MHGTQLIRSSKTLTLTFFLLIFLFPTSQLLSIIDRVCVFYVYNFLAHTLPNENSRSTFFWGKYKTTRKKEWIKFYTQAHEWMRVREKMMETNTSERHKKFSNEIFYSSRYSKSCIWFFIPPFSSILLFSFFLPAHTRHIIVALSC